MESDPSPNPLHPTWKLRDGEYYAAEEHHRELQEYNEHLSSFLFGRYRGEDYLG
jgi:hypothetical protein